jgi:4-carboxymuconolactone decarboxylase
MEYLPAPFIKFKKDFPEILEAYEGLAEKCHASVPFDEKTRRLIKLGIAVGTQSEGAVKSHTRRALAIGITKDEVYKTLLLALTTVGFPAMIAAMGWALEVFEKE